MADERRVPIDSELDIVAARVEGRNMAKELGFGIIDQARIATVISELARNVIHYAGSGQVILSPLVESGKIGLEIVCEDQGPGIADLASAMGDGSSMVRSEGMGLPGARRLMDEFEILSKLGAGTKIIARKWML
jgi:serine/threonine-protein kinase RsbT